MKRGRPVLVMMIFACVSGTFAQNRQDIVPLDSPIYRWIDDLALIGGLSLPFTARPWSRAEAQLVLARFERDGDLESPAARRLVAACAAELEVNSRIAEANGLALDADPAASVEAYGFAPIALEGGVDGDALARVVDYRRRLPLVDLPLSLWAGESIAANLTVELRDDYRAIDDSWTVRGTDPPKPASELWPVSLNVVPPLCYDTFLPFRAWVAFGGTAFSLQFGRDNLSWGNGFTGNLMLGDTADYHDFLRLRFFGDWFSFTSVFAAIQSDEDDPARAPAGFACHRLELRFRELFTVAFSESVAIQRPDSPLGLIHDLNPLLVYHGWLAPSRANSLMTAELTVTPARGLALYGQFALDEAKTGPEAAVGDRKPQAFGWLGGVRAAFALGDGVLSCVAEGALTDPWLYNRYEAPYYRWQRRIWSFVDPQSGFWPVKPIGYAAGPDAIVLACSARYEVPAAWKASAGFTWTASGENGLLATFPDPSDPDLDDKLGLTTPSGTVEHRFETVLSASWNVLEFLELSSTLALVDIENVAHVGGDRALFLELAIGATVAFR